jgi:cyclophilin family peptidyl-prolyl cis-trans isomerase
MQSTGKTACCSFDWNRQPGYEKMHQTLQSSIDIFMEWEEGMTIMRAISRIVFYCRRYRFGQMYLRIAACAVIVSSLSSPLFAANTIVRMEVGYGTNRGNVDIELYDDQAPKTVSNFLRYAGRGDYNYNIIHRSVPGFVIQGGGFNIYGLPYHMVVDPPVQNEFSPLRSNLRGTIAMAKLGSNPDSATSEWFFNLANNGGVSPNGLDFQNGGFTVFGHVLAGMNVVDDIAGLQILDHSDAGQAFGELPVINYDPAIGLQPDNLVQVTRIPNVKGAPTPSGGWAIFTADVDMTFNSMNTVDAATAVSLLASFVSQPNQSVYFNNGMFSLTMSGVMGTSGRVVTLHDGATARPTRYYAYGPTLDDPAPHWYDFSYDGVTGAEIMSDRMILHFVDGKRGDDDLAVNDSITHTGAQAVVTENTSSSSQARGGCSIVATPSQTWRGGDWIVVSLFLASVALVRRRARNGRIQRVPR